MSSTSSTLADITRTAQVWGGQPFYSFVPTGELVPTETSTFAEFMDGTLRVATELQAAGEEIGAVIVVSDQERLTPAVFVHCRALLATTRFRAAQDFGIRCPARRRSSYARSS